MNFPNHRFYEDLIALLCAGISVSFALVLFGMHNLITGGMAGLAIIGMELSELSFGVLFFVGNLPFYYIAWTKLSKRFTVNTFISVTVVAVMTEQMGSLIDIKSIDPLFSSLAGGVLLGMGVLIMFRHKSSLGGLGIMALYLQNRFNIRAGHFGLAVDAVILSSSIIVFNLQVVVLSVLAAAVMNVLIAVNHKPGRYQVYVESTPDASEANSEQGLK